MRLSHLALASLPLLSLVAGDADPSEATLQSSAGPIGISWESDRYSGYGPYGVPLNITNIDDELPQNFLADIYARIPDGQRISPDYLDVSSRSNLVVDEDFTGEVTVRVTYLNEGAGYRNTFGYFVYDAANPPQQFSDIADHRIIFPNASKPGGGRLL